MRINPSYLLYVANSVTYITYIDITKNGQRHQFLLLESLSANILKTDFQCITLVI